MTETEFTPRPEDLEVAEQLRRMKTEAEAQEVPTKKCIHGEFMLYLPHDRSVLPGHIRSELGLREARISSCCESHFDRDFDEDWVDPLTGLYGPFAAHCHGTERPDGSVS